MRLTDHSNHTGDTATMDIIKHWEELTLEEKNHRLYLEQKILLDTFLEHGAITQAEHDRSMHDLREKTGEND